MKVPMGWLWTAGCRIDCIAVALGTPCLLVSLFQTIYIWFGSAAGRVVALIPSLKVTNTN
jgi:hypothetical protein